MQKIEVISGYFQDVKGYKNRKVRMAGIFQELQVTMKQNTNGATLLSNLGN